VSLATALPELATPLVAVVANKAPARPIPDPDITQLATIGMVK